MESKTAVLTVADEEMVEVMEGEICENVPFENTSERMSTKRAITDVDNEDKRPEAHGWDGAAAEPSAKRERKDIALFPTEHQMVMTAWGMLIDHRHSVHLRRVPKDCLSSTDPVYQLVDLNGLQKEIDADVIKTLEDFMLRFQLMFTNMFIFVRTSAIFRVYAKEMYNECYSEYERLLSQALKAYHLYRKRGGHLMDPMFPANSGSMNAPLNFDLPKKLENASHFYEATEVPSFSRHRQMSEKDSALFDKQLMLTAWNALINHTHSMALRYSEMYTESCTCFVQETHDLITLKEELDEGKIQGPKDMLRKILHLFANVAMISSYGHPMSFYAREVYRDTFAHCYRLLTNNAGSGRGSDPTTSGLDCHNSEQTTSHANLDHEFFAGPSAKKGRY